MEKEVLLCDCHSSDHQILIFFDKDDKENIDVYAHVHLAKRKFWSRVKYGFKYIFGYKSRYGAWDEFIFNPEDADKLQAVVDYLKINKNK